MQKNNRQFIEFAEQHFDKKLEVAKGELDTRKEGFDMLGKQIKEVITKVDLKIESIERTRKEEYGNIGKYLKIVHETNLDVGGQAKRLAEALGNSRVRGNWAEIQLRNVVKSAGMLEHCDFTEQDSSSDRDTSGRPDMVVKLPNGAVVVVDAKAPLDAFRDAYSTDDEAVYRRKMVEHVAAVKAHIKALGRKNYPSLYENSLEYTLMFLFGDSFFVTAVNHETDILRFAEENKVIIVTPTSLIAFLKAVSYGWRELQLQENAEKIRVMGNKLHKYVQSFTEKFAKMGRSLTSTVRDYNQAVGTMDGRLIPAAKQFESLGTSSGKTLEEAIPIEAVVREVADASDSVNEIAHNQNGHHDEEQENKPEVLQEAQE